MNQLQVCEKVYNGELSASQAHELLVPKINTKLLKRARFIKMRIHLPNESRKLNTFLKILFALPIPLFIARWGLNIAGKKAGSHHGKHEFTDEISLDEIKALLKYAKGTRIKVESNDAVIRIIIK
ncbi:hypothetical protein [Liberiplasma polymorphum]|uniref:hypothetical protein n=1 Tax=Liberiplasma polymorphum TaxID=3374570 RepID=UPI003774422B